LNPHAAWCGEGTLFNDGSEPRAGLLPERRIEMNTEPTVITEEVIKRDIKKGYPFCSTLSMSEAIRNVLAERGYTPVVHRQGWTLLYQLMSHERPWVPEPALTATPQELAMAELDALDNEYFAYARACIDPRYPEQARYLFKNLKVGTGPEAVTNVMAYVERIQAMRDGTNPRREALREADRAAVLLLEERKVAGPEIEARLLALCEQVMAIEPAGAPDPYRLDEAEYQALAREFHIWLKDWRETARVAFKSRRVLIRLGLARLRKKPKPAAPEQPVKPAEVSDTRRDREGG